MTTQRSSYRQIFKGTTLFGGVQILNIVITIIRGKLTAILLGTTGMGINGLFMSSINMIKNGTSLGLPESAVRDIAEADGTGNSDRVAIIVTVFKHWIWFTALLGIVVTLFLAHYLSILLFENEDYTFSFILLSVVLVFGALTSGTYTLLRGMRMLRYLAIANITGSMGGLLVVIPIYYFYGINGIVPAIIASAIITWLISLYFKGKINIPVVQLTHKETFSKGKNMVKLGVVLSFNAFLIIFIRFIVNAYITRNGSIEDVGLYNAGITITVGYVGLVFTAMATDYFPRLSAAISDSNKWRQIVLHQAELVLLILGPILVLLVTTAPWVIKILLTNEFLPAVDYINWAVLGLFIQGVIWSLGVIVVAKGDLRIKLITEIIGKIVVLLTSVVGYTYMGLQGLGIAFLVSNIFSLVLISAVSHIKYNFRFSLDFLLLFSLLLLACVMAFAGVFYLEIIPALFTGMVIFILVSSYSYYHLNKRLDFSEAFKTLTKRFRR